MLLYVCTVHTLIKFCLSLIKKNNNKVHGQAGDREKEAICLLGVYHLAASASKCTFQMLPTSPSSLSLCLSLSLQLRSTQYKVVNDTTYG